MKITLKIMTKEQYKRAQHLTEEEFCEWYGEEAEKLYWFDGKFCGSYIGVKTGSCFSVFGCGKDLEDLTEGKMLEILLGEFEE